jgi:hypothetical protein
MIFMIIKIKIKKENIINANRKTPLALLISLLYPIVIYILSIFVRHVFFEWGLLFCLLIIFYNLLQLASYMLSKKYLILDNLYNGRLMGYVSAIIMIFFVIFITYVVIFYHIPTMIK